MIKGYFIDSDGKVQTFEKDDRMVLPTVPHFEGEVVMDRPRRNWKVRRRNKLRCNIVRASVFAALFGAIGFASTLSGSDPNWAVGLTGAGINLAWVATVLGVNGGKINVE